MSYITSDSSCFYWHFSKHFGRWPQFFRWLCELGEIVKQWFPAFLCCYSKRKQCLVNLHPFIANSKECFFPSKPLRLFWKEAQRGKTNPYLTNKQRLEESTSTHLCKRKHFLFSIPLIMLSDSSCNPLEGSWLPGWESLPQNIEIYHELPQTTERSESYLLQGKWSVEKVTLLTS